MDENDPNIPATSGNPTQHNDAQARSASPAPTTDNEPPAQNEPPQQPEPIGQKQQQDESLVATGGLGATESAAPPQPVPPPPQPDAPVADVFLRLGLEQPAAHRERERERVPEPADSPSRSRPRASTTSGHEASIPSSSRQQQRPVQVPHFVAPSSYLRPQAINRSAMAMATVPEPEPTQPPTPAPSVHDKDQYQGLQNIREFLKVRCGYDVFPLSFRLIVLDNDLLIKKSLNIMIQNCRCLPEGVEQALTRSQLSCLRRYGTRIPRHSRVSLPQPTT